MIGVAKRMTDVFKSSSVRKEQEQYMTEVERSIAQTQRQLRYYTDAAKRKDFQQFLTDTHEQLTQLAGCGFTTDQAIELLKLYYMKSKN